jgi:phenylacetate-CoA ligase
MPVVDEIIGRLEDVVVAKDGREMVRFHSIFTGMPNIIKGQVVQEAIDDITLNIVAVSPLTESEKQILKERLYNQLGNVNVYISELKEIPAGANGKFRAVISKIKKS